MKKFQTFFQKHDLVVKYVGPCFSPPFDPDRGWTIRMPDIEWHDDLIVMFYFQDHVTYNNGQIFELERLEQMVGDRARQCVVLHFAPQLQDFYTGALHLLEWNYHCLAIAQNLGGLQDRWRHNLRWPRSRPWMSLNGRICPHRKNTANILKNLPNGILSLGQEIPLEQFDYSHIFGREHETNFIDLSPIYGDCAVNIITETQYGQVPGLITEKTLLALMAGQIPLIIGHAGAVQDCMDYGWDMFTDLVDTSYDHLPDSSRLTKALESNIDLITGKIDLGPYEARLRQQVEYFLIDYVSHAWEKTEQRCDQIARIIRN